MKKLVFLLSLLMILTSAAAVFADAVLLQREDWADDVKQAVNDFVLMYGNSSPDYHENAYVVFDFDHTVGIFDIENATDYTQIQMMAFALEPKDFRKAVLPYADMTEEQLSANEDGMGAYADWEADITAAYTYLYETYGPFNGEMLDAEKAALVQADPMWLEFASKMAAIEEVAGTREPVPVLYAWYGYRFAGMTHDQVYNLAFTVAKRNQVLETASKQWVGPEDIESKLGSITGSWVEGMSVSENAKELWHVLMENGIDVWVCSGSIHTVIEGAIDAFGLHDECTGFFATHIDYDDNGMILPQRDPEGHPLLSEADGKWSQGEQVISFSSYAEGKTSNIEDALVTVYGEGPLAGFMDSSGDFNFCTEFDSLKLVIVYNRNRKVSDGGGLLSAVAMYERDALGYDLASANAAGDTLYLLQGRDENGLRSFRNSNASILLGASSETLFKNESVWLEYQAMVRNHMSVKEAIDTFAISSEADELLPVSRGFLDDYIGYHALVYSFDWVEEAAAAAN